MVERDGSEGAREWAISNLTFVEGGLRRRPPREVVELVCEFGLSAAFDIGWSQCDYNHRSEVTYWKATLATASHLLDVTAQAQVSGGRIWSGDTRDTEQFVAEPVISGVVSRIAAVRAVTVRLEGSSDPVKGSRPKPIWAFSFEDGEPREFVPGAYDEGVQDRVRQPPTRQAGDVIGPRRSRRERLDIHRMLAGIDVASALGDIPSDRARAHRAPPRDLGP